MTAKEHNQILGVLFLIFGGCNLLLLVPATIQIVATVNQLEEINKGLGNANSVNLQASVTSFLILVVILGVFSLVSSIVQITAGFGIVTRKHWARAAAALAGIMALIIVPIGTALGIYALWFLFGRAGKEFYESQFLKSPPAPRKSRL